MSVPPRKNKQTNEQTQKHKKRKGKANYIHHHIEAKRAFMKATEQNWSCHNPEAQRVKRLSLLFLFL